MNVDELVDLIASRERPFPEISDAPRGARYADLPDETFIPPELGIEWTWGPGDAPNVLLIFAPAAVGKSILARHLARITHNPYWDLSAFRLGSAFFNGTIAKTYGVPAVESFTKELKNGELTLILDAVDEASVGSTSTNYFAAIDDLASMVRGVSAHHCQAVILGREETVLETAGRLDALGVRVGLLSVGYFAEDRAKEFVRIVAEGTGGRRVLPDFENFLNEFFSRVMAAFASSGWSDVESFLGYAPVLDSVATFYREADNAYATLKEFSAPSSYLAVWDLLRNLIWVILERERGKFANSFGGDDEAKRRFAASAYEPTDQCRLLLSPDPEQVASNPDLTEDVEAEWLTDIENSLHDWFRYHPFTPAYSNAPRTNPLKGFANAAFRDFTVALSVHVADPALCEDAASFLRAHDVNASVMLSRFLEVDAKRSALPALPGALVGAVVDSHAAGGVAQRPLMIVERSDDHASDEDLPGLVMVFDTGGANDGVELPVSAGDEIVLGRDVSNVVVHAPNHDVSMGSYVPEAQLGPVALIRSRHFTSRSAELRVAGTLEQCAVIETGGIGGNTRLIHGSQSSLRLRVPPVAYPWERFRVAVNGSSEFTRADLLSMGLELRGIAYWFSLGSGKFDAVKMDTILSKGRASRRLFDYCMHDDVVWRDGKEYRFGPPFANTVVQGVAIDNPDYQRWLQRAWRWIGQ